MIIFGQPWNAPICEVADTIPTPVGEPCAWCRLPIADGDRGVAIPGMAAACEPVLQPWHRECFLRSTVGSPAHLRGRCDVRCSGDDTEAGPGPSTPEEIRAEALESWRIVTGEEPLRCGLRFELPFGNGTATCTRESHLPGDPWHRDDNRRGVHWKNLDRDEPPAAAVEAAMNEGADQ